jgi:hypothetical protein
MLASSEQRRTVAGHVPSQRAAALVRQDGIDFSPDEEYLRTLRVVGGDDALIAALLKPGAVGGHRPQLLGGIVLAKLAEIF